MILLRIKKMKKNLAAEHIAGAVGLERLTYFAVGSIVSGDTRALVADTGG